MGYYMELSYKYMRKHVARTLYSIFGTLLTFMLVFCALTTGYSLWDYALEAQYADEYGKVQLRIWDGLTKEDVEKAAKHAYVARLVVEDWTVGENEDVRQVALDELEDDHSYYLYIGLKDTSDLRQSAAVLQEYLGAEVTVDEDVELYLGQGDSLTLSLYNSIVVILGAVFAVFSILLIRNIMMISVVERMHDYGLMRCVGMSKRQLTWLLLTEGMLVGICGAIGGMGCGYGILQIFASWLNRQLSMLPVPFHFGFYPKALLYTTVICLATILYALLEPARQAGLISPIDAVYNNVALRKHRGGMGDKIRYHSGHLWGALFGAPGEYAYKNMMRSRGRFIYLFMGMLICMTLTGSVYSFADSAFATVKGQYKGQHWEFAETISMDAPYSDTLYQEISSDLQKIDGVKDTGIILQREDYTFYDPRLAAQNINWCLQLGYDKSHLEQLKPYLTAGEISYERMQKENGILLCDSLYNVRDEEGNWTNQRISDYEVGDTISLLSAKGYSKADRIYRDTVAQAAKNMDIHEVTLETDEGEETYEPRDFDSDCPGFKKLLKETLRLLGEEGYDCGSIQDISEYATMYGVRDNLEQLLYQQGEKDEYRIQGIISENIFNGVGGYGTNVISLIQPDTVFYPILSEEPLQGTSQLYRWEIGLTRDINKLNDAIRQYCEDKSASGCFMHYTDEEADTVNHALLVLKVAKMAAAIIGGCIALISMIQIFNTVCAGMSLRRKELWLYQVTGMSPGQRRLMILLENNAAVLLAVLIGLLLSWGISWYFVEHLLNQDDFIQYVYPLGKNLLLALVLLGLTSIAGLLGQKSSN